MVRIVYAVCLSSGKVLVPVNSPTHEAIEAGTCEPHVARCVALGAPRAVGLEIFQYGSLPMFQLLDLLHELLDVLGGDVARVPARSVLKRIAL